MAFPVGGPDEKVSDAAGLSQLMHDLVPPLLGLRQLAALLVERLLVDPVVMLVVMMVSRYGGVLVGGLHHCLERRTRDSTSTPKFFEHSKVSSPIMSRSSRRLRL